MPNLGFTGTRAIDSHALRLQNYLESPDMVMFLRRFDVYVTGACRGWDGLVGRYLRLKFPPPVAEHVVIVPANRSQVDPGWEEFDVGSVLVIEMPEGTDYKDRNTEIVKRSNHLFYCADYPEDHGKSKRSGTWQTKRIAEKLGVSVDGIILNAGQ